MTLDAYYRITRKPLDHPLGYLVAISGTLMELMCYGINNGFSTFSEDMINDPTLGRPSRGLLGYGNSVAVGISPLIGVFAGLLVDRFPSRALMLASTLFMFLGLWIGSVAKNLEGVIFGYCLMASTACALMISPSITTTGTWFKKNLSIAEGINACGGGLGSIIIQPVSGYLVEHYGWRRGFRYTSLFCLVGVLASIFSCKRAEPIEDSKGEPRDTMVKGISGSEENSKKLLSNDSEKCLSNMQAQLETIPQGGPTVHDYAGRGESNDDPTFADVSSNMHEHRTMVRFSTAEESNNDSPSNHEDLMHAVNTRQLSIIEILRTLISREFLANFFMYFFFLWFFAGILWAPMHFFTSMGVKGTPYENAKFLGPAVSSTLFIFWGAFEILGSLSMAYLVKITSEPFVYILCCAVGAIVCLITPFFRTYALFAVSMSIEGFCTAGIYMLIPCFLVRQFRGPNLGFFMSTVFVGGCVGGICSPIVMAYIQEATNTFTPCYILMGCFMFIPPVLCFFLLSRQRMCKVPFCTL